MNDTVTIITSATDNQIVKAFRGLDHQLLKFSPGEKFLVTQHPVHDLQSLEHRDLQTNMLITASKKIVKVRYGCVGRTFTIFGDRIVKMVNVVYGC